MKRILGPVAAVVLAGLLSMPAGTEVAKAEIVSASVGLLDHGGDDAGTLYAGKGFVFADESYTTIVIHLPDGMEIAYNFRFPNGGGFGDDRADHSPLEFSGWVEIYQPDLGEAHLSVLEIMSESDQGVEIGDEVFYQSLYFQGGLAIEPTLPSPLQSSATEAQAPNGLPDARHCKGGMCTCACWPSDDGDAEQIEGTDGTIIVACCPEGKTPVCNCTPPECSAMCTVDAQATPSPTGL